MIGYTFGESTNHLTHMSKESNSETAAIDVRKGNISTIEYIHINKTNLRWELHWRYHFKENCSSRRTS